MILIPVPKDTRDLSVTSSLDGVEYHIRIRWNSRAGWYMRLSDINDVNITSWRTCVPGTDWLASVRWDERCPPGMLTIFQITPGQDAPGLNDFVADSTTELVDGTFAIFYLTQAEIENG